MSINRLFDINLKDAESWTQGEDWAECNPVQDLNEIYHRIYSNSPEDDPNFRLERGDNFYIGAHPSEIRDWTPRKTPWNFDIDEAREGAWFSFYFGHAHECNVFNKIQLFRKDSIFPKHCNKGERLPI